MKADGEPHKEKIPSLVWEDLQNTKPLSEEELRSYDFLKADFLDAVRRAGLISTELSPTADVVFSVIGRIVERTRQIMEIALQPPLQLQPATRSARAKGPAQQETRLRGAAPQPAPVSRVVKQAGDVQIEIATYMVHAPRKQAESMLQVEVGIIDSTSGKDVRPYTVRVFDLDGNELLPPTAVGKQNTQPRFPGPNPGVYRFAFSWEDRQEDVLVEFRDTSDPKE